METAARPPRAAAFPRRPVPLLLAPRTAEVALDLTLEPTTPAVDFCRGLPETFAQALAPLGAHHVEQSGAWRGRVEIDGARHDVRGHGQPRPLLGPPELGRRGPLAPLHGSSRASGAAPTSSPCTRWR